MIKRLMRISSKPFDNFGLDLSLYSISHTLAHLEHSWRTLELEKGKQRKDKEVKGRKYQERKSRIRWLQRD